MSKSLISLSSAITFSFISFVTNASNLDDAIERSIQLPIKGADNGEIAHKDWYFWSKQDLDKFNYINTYVIHPIASDKEWVTYKGCTSDFYSGDILHYSEDILPSCSEHTDKYIDRMLLQIKEIKESNTNARIYLGVPHAAESDKIPNDLEIQSYLHLLKIKMESEGINLKSITGLYVTDEIYNGNIGDEDFQYFVRLRSEMYSNSDFQNMPLMWMPQYRREMQHSKISNLLEWQHNNSTIFNRIVIQPGFYNKNAGQYYDTAVRHVKNWVSQNNVNGIHAGSNTRIGAMLEASPAVDWCTSYVSKGSSLLAHGNITYRPQYAIQHTSFMGLSDAHDINFFVSQKTGEWDKHTTDWELNNGATASRGNPYIFVDKYFEKSPLGYNSMNQSFYCE